MLITDTLHPHDPQWRAKRHSLVHKELLTMNERQIEQSFLHQAAQPLTPESRQAHQETTRKVLGEMFTIPGLADNLIRKSILDSTGGGSSGGSVLIRQDLEPYLYA